MAPRGLTFLVILLLAGAQSSRPERKVPDHPKAEEATAIEIAVWRLADEARQTQINRTLPEKPDYAGRCELELTQDEVSAAIRTKHFQKVFIDAYARWQLTSFDPPLGVTDDASMLELTRLGPGLVQNPWASHRTIRLFKAMVDMGELDEQQMTYCRERQAMLEEDLGLTKQFSRPLHEVRKWIADRVDDPLHQAFWMVSECIARAAAGWPVSEQGDLLKRTEAAIAKVAADPAITPERRTLLADMIRNLTEINREVVTSVTFEDASMNASIVWAAVDDETIRRWDSMVRPVETPKP